MKSASLSIHVSVAVALFAIVASARAATADPPRRAHKEQATPSNSEGQRITRVYLIDDLLYVPNDYPFRGSLPTRGPFELGGARTTFGARGAMGAMGGGGMGGGMSGGGMFSVPNSTSPPTVLRQFGGGGSGGGAAVGGGGGGGAAGGGSAPVVVGGFGGTLSPVPRALQLINLIKHVVKAEWDDDDGSRDDQCIMFGNSLVVRATAETQQEVAALLKSLQHNIEARSVTVEATWIVLDPLKLEELQGGAARTAHGMPALDHKLLSTLAQEGTAFRGQITCLNGQTVHFATGQRRVVPSGATPTVGVGAVGYTSSVEVLNIGAVLQVTPMVTLVGDRRSALLDLHSVVTQWGKPGEPIKVTSQSAAGMSEKSTGGPLVNNMATIDRVNMGAQEWSSTVSIPLGEPVLVGAATLTDPNADGDTAKRPELGLIIEVRPNF